MTDRKKRPLVYEIKLGAPDTVEGRADMARMLRVYAAAMTQVAGELERDVGKAVLTEYRAAHSLGPSEETRK